MDRIAPGILFLYLLYAVLLTIPVSLVLIWWYKTAVGRSMAVAGTADLPAAIDYLAPPIAASPRSPGLQNLEARVRLRLSVVYIFAALCAALFWTLLLFRSGGLDFTPLRGFIVTYTYAWPAVPTLIALVALDRRRSFQVLLGYVALGVLVTVLWSAVSQSISGSRAANPWMNGWQAARLIAVTASLPGLILLIVANRRIRGVSPLVLAGLLVFTFSAAFFNEFLIRLADHSGLLRVLFVFGATRMGFWFMLATVPVGYLCWRLLVLLNRQFQRKSFSDMQFLADSFWIIVSFAIAADLATSLGWKGLWALAGFAVYRAAVSIGFALWRAPREPGVSLLVLRVFGFSAPYRKTLRFRSSSLAIQRPVRMIAGTDLAARTIDPDDSLAFASGALRTRFVGSAEDLTSRLRQLDEARDPDGHFRVTEFFCHANTWTHALVALLARSDAILMDLRGFNQNRSGCLFELDQLKLYGRLPQTIFVVDSNTDLNLLNSTLSQIGAAFSPLHLEEVKTDSIQARNRVYRALESLNAGHV